VVDWGRFLPWFLSQWDQGQHVTMVGTTGSGKTTLAKQLLPRRSFVAIFGVKGRDETLEEFIDTYGYVHLRRWNGDVSDHVVLWPDLTGPEAMDHQRATFHQAMGAIYRAGAWCLFLDEVVYLSETLRLERDLKFLLNQGRSSGISIVAATQRPAFIPLAFYDQPTHYFFWRDTDARNIKRIGELTGMASRQTMREVASLQRREVLYFNKDTGFRVRTTVEV
jgi:energy-coupling factor transporter ATP-binding protein EcfA2